MYFSPFIERGNDMLAKLESASHVCLKFWELGDLLIKSELLKIV